MKSIAAVAAGLAIALATASNASATLLYSSFPDLTTITPSGTATGGIYRSPFTVSGGTNYSQVSEVQFVIQRMSDAPADTPFMAMRWGLSDGFPAQNCCINTFFYYFTPGVSWVHLTGENYLVTLDVGLVLKAAGVLGPNPQLVNGDYTFDLSGVGGGPLLTIPTYSGGAGGLFTNNGLTVVPLSGTAAFAVFGGVDPVPEPATWAMLITGFGLIGLSLRRRATRHDQADRAQITPPSSRA